jgi:hypothetical protein
MIVGCLVACSSREATQDPAARASAAPAAAVPIDAARVRDVELPALVDAAIGQCEWDAEHGLSERCEAVELLLRHATDEASAVELLERTDDPKRRHLAARILDRRGTAYRTDRGLATRILAVAKSERSSAVIFPLGFAVSRIDLTATGTVDLVRALVTTHPDHIMRGHAIADLIRSNPTPEPAVAIVIEAFRDKNWVVRMFAIADLAESGHAPCELIARTIADEDAVVAETAVRAIRDHAACEGMPAEVIDAVTRRLAAGRLRYDPNVGVVLQKFCQVASTSATDRANAAALGARMVAMKDLADFRASGLYTVFECDPEAGRKLARTVRTDRDLAAAARDILAR